jgi:amino acid transporter
VSGGPYGIEDMVPSFGPGMTLVLLLLTPVFWSLPVALAMSELAAAMPEEGGYVTWTRRAFGPFWAFQVGWWSWIDSFVDVAVYPALFVEYVRFWHPAMTLLERWLLVLAFVGVLTALNVIGVRPTGYAAVVLAVAALLPIVAFTLVGLGAPRLEPWTPLVSEGQGLEALGLGLAVVMWNYSGWDTPATVLGETRAPASTFRLAAFLALPVLTAFYVVPIGAALASGAVEWSTWTTGILPLIARRMGGDWLGHAVAAGAVVSTAGLFLSLLLTNSRLPYVLARERAMPAWLGAVHRRFGTPWAAVVVSAAIYATFAAFSFKELIVLNIWLYSLSLLVELAAFVWLRVAAPDLPRPWRVRGGFGGAVAVVVFPAAFMLGALATAGWLNTLVGVVAALTGPAAYAVLVRPTPDSPR